MFLILSCLPCADKEVNSYAHSATEFTSNHDNHSHDKQIDLCSPFCTCNCCSAQVLTYFPVTAINFSVVATVIKAPLPTYKSIFASNFYGSIWQPPQIA